jgi:hypothetical protein
MRRIAALIVLALVVALPWIGSTPTAGIGLGRGESTSWLMAESLAHDGDLRFTTHDRDRALGKDRGDAAMVRLMSADGWKSAYFAEPCPYPLVAAPFALAGGERGLLALNLALFAGLVALGATHLGRSNPPALAIGLAALYFVLGGSLVAAFRVGPTLLDSCAVAAALLLVLDPDAAPRPRAGLRTALGGALLALAAYDQPIVLFLFVPLAFACRRRAATLAGFLLGGVAGLAALAAASAALTPAAVPYLGIERRELPASSAPPPPRAALAEAQGSVFPVPGAGSVAPPRIALRRLGLDAADFLGDRHAGILVHHFPLVLALFLFLGYRRRCADRWVLLGAIGLASLALFVWLPEDWDGSGARLGNPRWVVLYPTFLFLVGRIAALPVTLALGIVSAVLATPSLGALAASRGAIAGNVSLAERTPLRRFPVNPRIIAGAEPYVCMDSIGLVACAPSDTYQGFDTDLHFPAGRRELWIVSPARLEPPLVRINRLAPGESATITLEGAASQATAAVPTVEIEPPRHPLRRQADDTTAFVYRLAVTAPHAVTLSWLRSRTERDADLYHVEWLKTAAPDKVAPGTRFEVNARFGNRSAVVWPGRGPASVRLAHHWLGADGRRVDWEGARSEIGFDLEPGAFLALEHTVVAPAEPGRYDLVLDLVYEDVAWFSERDPALARHLAIEVTPPPVAAEGK